MSRSKPRFGWVEKRREGRQLKRERTADSPEKRAERRKRQDATPKDGAGSANTGNIGGTGIL